MDPEEIFKNEIEILKSMFGDSVSASVILAVLESCNGDVNAAADGIMTLAGDSPTVEENATAMAPTYLETEIAGADDQGDQGLLNPAAPAFTPSNYSIQNQMMQESAELTAEDIIPPPVSYSSAFKSTGALPRPRDNQVQKQTNANNWVTDQIRKIFDYNKQGTRVLIIMRGVPGSGKSYLARRIIENTIGEVNYSTHIFSSDDFFLVRGKYVFNREFLQEAHMNNQKKVCSALSQGLSPVIVDNTNTAAWEMEPYVRDGVRNGYYIELITPSTPWARNANQLSKKNIHNVPKDKINSMLERFEDNITTSFLLKHFKISYPPNRIPPVVRNIPKFVPENSIMAPDKTITEIDHGSRCSVVPTPIKKKPMELLRLKPYSCIPVQESKTSIAVAECSYETVGDQNTASYQNINKDDDIFTSEDQKRVDFLLETQKKLKTIQTLEKEWDNSEGWDDKNASLEVKNDTNTPKPPRQPRSRSIEPIIKPSDICDDDWSKIGIFLKPWQDKPIDDCKENIINTVETNTTGTSIELGDSDNIHSLFKELCINSRDINKNTKDNKKEKIPHQRSLDKSTSTHEHTFNSESRCQNEEKHFSAFRKMFRDVPRPVLRDVFEKCHGDVNWAVNIILDSMGDSPLEVGITDISDSDEDDDGDSECECLAAYSVIPDKKAAVLEPVAGTSKNTCPYLPGPSSPAVKKVKRERINSDTTLQLKRQLEKNVIIGDEHYSPHHLSLRRARRENSCIEQGQDQAGAMLTENISNDDKNVSTDQNVLEIETDNKTANGAAEDKEITTANDPNVENVPKDENIEVQVNILENVETDDDRSSNSDAENVSINLGMDFIRKLDGLFGREGIIYPENISPTINVPMSLLSEINALWAESIAYQMEEASKQTEEMVRQDEEFARQLVLKENQIATTSEGGEPSQPDLKEIMDMELALSIYNKDVAQWKNNEPDNIAAKMTRAKLCDLFPDINRDTLCELLVAHDNRFQATVKSLLCSTGQGHILEIPNGINKFVKEFEEKTKILNEELSESEWPFLSDEKVDMETVERYRQKAEQHLRYYNKARSRVDKNVLGSAAYFAEVAAYNKQQYELANSLAAASLVQYHTANKANEILDLHYLRVAEAREVLDVFLDCQILRLRARAGGSGGAGSAGGAGGAGRAHALFVVTGRGAHSGGRARIKPAVIKRLKDRGLTYRERNPGLLVTKVTCYHKTTEDLLQEQT